MTLIELLDNDFWGNCLYVKREDLLPFSFGGNKARKAQLIFNKIDSENVDYVVTYGSSSSNHCRVVALSLIHISRSAEGSRSTYRSEEKNIRILQGAP